MGLRPRPGTNSVCRWPESVGENSMVVASGGRNWVARDWCPFKRPGAGVGATPVQPRWARGSGDSCGQEPKSWHMRTGKLDRLGSSTYA